MAEGSKFARSLRSPWQWVGVVSILVLVGFPITAPMFTDRNAMLGHHGNSTFLKAHSIGLAMYSYAQDNNGRYPTGKSSTEVFQKLLDGGYARDPSIFYCDMPGKKKPTSRQLRPKNVCWDVTISLEEHDSDCLPVVFQTGYKVQYFPNGRAVPLITASRENSKGVAVFYKDNSTAFRENDGLPDGIVTDFVSPGFGPEGKTYQQLTPDGVLGP